MKQVTIEEAQKNLSKLIKQALMGERIIIAKGEQPLIELVVLPEAKTNRRLGGLQDVILHVSPDFDDPLDDFAEYLV